MLTRDLILAASDLPTEEVQAPEWGGSVFVRTMSGTERDAFEQSVIDGKANATSLDNVRARLAVKVICDAAGTRLFTDADADALGAKSGKVLDRVFEVAQRLNGIGADAVKSAEGN